MLTIHSSFSKLRNNAQADKCTLPLTRMGPQSSVLLLVVVLTLTEAGTGRLLWPARSVMSGAMVLWKEPDALAASHRKEKY